MATNETKALTTPHEKAEAFKALLFSEDTLLELKRALPRHLGPDRMARLALTEFRKTPELANCNPASVIAAVLNCAQLGLEFGQTLGHAYLIPFKDEATLMIGYKGYIELALRSGKVLSIQAEAVFENDEFEYEFGLEPKLRHTPAKGNRGELTHTYAIAWFKNGARQFVVMTRDEIDAIRRGSKNGNSGPWKNNFPEMGKKTAIRRLQKHLPLSPELRKAEEFDKYDAIDVEFETMPAGEGRQVHPGTGEVQPDPGAIPTSATTVLESSASAAPETPSTEAPGQTSLPLGGEDKY